VSVELIKEMFDQMVVVKDPDAIARYYAPDFVMYSNGVTQEYEAFAKSHEDVYASDITYSVEYDESAWVEGQGRVAGRIWITTQLSDEPPTRIEVILIAVIVDGRITRVWETTWPNWADLKAFDSYD
jgi:SnoaL-like domain